MPGQGDFPVTEFAEAIHRIGYQGYWSLEIFNDRFRAGSASGVALDGWRSLQLMHDLVACRPRAPILPQMPPRASVTGVEFIEFAASDEEAGLGTMLRRWASPLHVIAARQSRGGSRRHQYRGQHRT
jgi:4-hydroxyphenylpyruvate dioxygenase